MSAKYPNEFLGRCSTCLDNANLGRDPCPLGYGPGQPLNDDECAIRRARRAYDADRSSDKEEGRHS